MCVYENKFCLCVCVHGRGDLSIHYCANNYLLVKQGKSGHPQSSNVRRGNRKSVLCSKKRDVALESWKEILCVLDKIYQACLG